MSLWPLRGNQKASFDAPNVTSSVPRRRMGYSCRAIPRRNKAQQIFMDAYGKALQNHLGNPSKRNSAMPNLIERIKRSRGITNTVHPLIEETDTRARPGSDYASISIETRPLVPDAGIWRNAANSWQSTPRRIKL